MKNKDRGNNANFNFEHDRFKMDDVDDRIIMGIYGGSYFKRKDVHFGRESTGTNSNHGRGVQPKKCQEEPDADSLTNRDNIKGMLIVVRILSRAKRLTNEHVTRYSTLYRIDEDIIRTCEKHAHIDLDRYLHLMDNLI